MGYILSQLHQRTQRHADVEGSTLRLRDHHDRIIRSDLPHRLRIDIVLLRQEIISNARLEISGIVE